VHSLARFLLMVFLSMGVWMAIGLGVEWRFLKQLFWEKQGDTSAKCLCVSDRSRQKL